MSSSPSVCPLQYFLRFCQGWRQKNVPIAYFAEILSPNMSSLCWLLHMERPSHVICQIAHRGLRGYLPLSPAQEGMRAVIPPHRSERVLRHLLALLLERQIPTEDDHHPAYSQARAAQTKAPGRRINPSVPALFLVAAFLIPRTRPPCRGSKCRSDQTLP